MRKLPVYLLLDTSGSMYGEPIEAVKNGVQVLVSTLRSDPYALETAYLSIITFNNTAQQVTPLTELANFQQPNIDASGCTALGEALSLLANIRKGLDEFRKRKFGMIVACAAGQGADTTVLKQITECVVSLDTAESATIKSFFKWVSASVSAGSMKVEETGKEMGTLSELPPPPPEVNIVV